MTFQVSISQFTYLANANEKREGKRAKVGEVKNEKKQEIKLKAADDRIRDKYA